MRFRSGVAVAWDAILTCPAPGGQRAISAASVPLGQSVGEATGVENVLAQRYASPEMVPSGRPRPRSSRSVGSGWPCCARSATAGVEIPAGGDRRLRGGHRPGRPGLDRRARADHPARRQGEDRGVQRARRPRADPQGNDQPGSDREHGAGPVISALRLVRDRSSRHWPGWVARAAEYADLVIAGRSHNVPAQATTLGKRFASAAEELLHRHTGGSTTCWTATRSGASRDPVGTAQDMLDLLGSAEAVDTLENAVVRELSARTGCSTASARCIRGPWTTRCSRRWCRWPQGRRRWPPRSG